MNKDDRLKTLRHIQFSTRDPLMFDLIEIILDMQTEMAELKQTLRGQLR